MLHVTNLCRGKRRCNEAKLIFYTMYIPIETFFGGIKPQEQCAPTISSKCNRLVPDYN